MNLTQFRFPEIFKKIGQRMPAPVATAPLLLMLYLAQRHTLLVAPESLYKRAFRIQVEDIGLSLCFWCDHGRFKSMADTGIVGVDERCPCRSAYFHCRREHVGSSPEHPVAFHVISRTNV